MFGHLKGKKYKIIYADPPWSYQNKYAKSRGAESHYPTMDLEQIQKIPVSDLADENCILLIWVTFPLLQEGLDTIKSWGFEYKTLGFSWLKLNKHNGRPFFGMGKYTRSNCEVCLLAVKGKPEVVSNSVSSAVISYIGEHSKKPDKVRTRIVQLLGDVPRIELFSREHIPGWDVWDLNLDAEHMKKKTTLTGIL